MKNFTATIMLAIGAYAAPYSGGQLHSKDTFMYGRFVASMKGGNWSGVSGPFTSSAFYLLGLDDINQYQSYDMNNINGIEVTESLIHRRLYTNVS